MILSNTISRSFESGTTGWSIDDLNDPDIERRWETGSYEFVEGVFTTMPPAFFDGSYSLDNLIYLIRRQFNEMGIHGVFGHEADLILGPQRIARPDAAFLTLEAATQQRELHALTGDPRLTYGRLRVPPTLIIESLSPGHEDHDRQTKRHWYADAGVPNYWLLNALEKSLECLILRGGDYQLDQRGQGDHEIRPSAFAGLVIPLGRVWKV
jgi:Uma2 family endonuclease